MRLVIGNPNKENLIIKCKLVDVTLVHGLFGPSSNMMIYDKLLREVNNCDKNDKLWKLWHGDTHFIVDDKLIEEIVSNI